MDITRKGRPNCMKNSMMQECEWKNARESGVRRGLVASLRLHFRTMGFGYRQNLSFNLVKIKYIQAYTLNLYIQSKTKYEINIRTIPVLHF